MVGLKSMVPLSTAEKQRLRSVFVKTYSTRKYYVYSDMDYNLILSQIESIKLPDISIYLDIIVCLDIHWPKYAKQI